MESTRPYTRLRVQNFPSPCNPHVPAAGTRTLYVECGDNDASGHGFPIMVDTGLIALDGTIHTLSKHSRVYLTHPGVIYHASSIGAKPRHAHYVQVGLTSAHPTDAVGYVRMSHIAKPTSTIFRTQPRFYAGLAAQDSIHDALQQRYPTSFSFISSATAASRQPDLQISIHGTLLQFEIKGRSTRGSHVTIFDRSVKRGTPNVLIDSLTYALTQGEYESLETLVDLCREVDTTVGFPGDTDAPKSGKLPPILRVRDDETTLTLVRDVLVNHLHACGDTYFAVYNRESSQHVEVFYTGHGANILGAPLLPRLDVAALDTHGGPYNNSMRVALKVHFHSQDVGLVIG